MPTPSRSPAVWRPGVEAANPRTGTIVKQPPQLGNLAVLINSATPVTEVRSYVSVANATPATGATVHAVMRGTAPNSKLVLDLVDPGANDAELAISVNGNTVTVSLATDAHGAITTTGATLVAALNADAAASKLMYGVAKTGAPGTVALTDQTLTFANGVVGDQWPEGTLWFFVNSTTPATNSLWISLGEVTAGMTGYKVYTWQRIINNS